MILEQARKQNVDVIVAHQYLSQLSQKTLDSLYANTSIKFAGGISDKDAHALARNMRCEPSFIAEQSKGSFAAFVRNTTKSALSLKFPLTRLDRLRMSDRQYATALKAIRGKYAVHYKEVQSEARIPPSPSKGVTGPAAISTPLASPPSSPRDPSHKKKSGKWPMPQ
jgi:hypothetical protein